MSPFQLFVKLLSYLTVFLIVFKNKLIFKNMYDIIYKNSLILIQYEEIVS